MKKVKTPFIDVILPFHQIDNNLEQAVYSVLNSLDVEVHLILINDSKDGSSPNFLNSILTDFTYVLAGGTGYALAINLARHYLKGDYVALMNSDDLSSALRLKRECDFLEDNNFDLVFCEMKKMSGRLPKIEMLGSLGREKHYDYRTLLLGSYGANATWMTKRKFWESLTFTDTASADWHLALKVFPKIKVGRLTQPLYTYRVHDDQVTKSEFYTQNALAEIIEPWMKLNRNEVLPDVPKKLISFICAPWAVSSREQKLSKTELEILLDWFKSFNESTLNNFSSISRRRILFLATKNPTFLMNYRILFTSLLGALSVIFRYLYLLAYNLL